MREQDRILPDRRVMIRGHRPGGATGIDNAGGRDEAEVGRARGDERLGLADVLAQFLGDQARGRVGSAACGKAHHQRHRFLGRKVLRAGRAGQQQG